MSFLPDPTASLSKIERATPKLIFLNLESSPSYLFDIHLVNVKSITSFSQIISAEVVVSASQERGPDGLFDMDM